MAVSERKRRFSPAVWTLIVLGIGVVLGLVTAVVWAIVRPPFRFPVSDTTLALENLDIVVSAVGLVFIVALLRVYVKTYRDTHARFALGLLVVLGALAFQAILSSPLVYSLFGVHLGRVASFFLPADTFKAAALGAFLYLSLQ